MKTLLDKLKEDLAAQDVRPVWATEPGLHPFCEPDSCPQHGRRLCSKTGHRPSDHCDVAVEAMARLLLAQPAVLCARCGDKPVAPASGRYCASCIDRALDHTG